MRTSALFVLLLTCVPCLAQGQQIPPPSTGSGDLPVTVAELAAGEVEVSIEFGSLNYSLRADRVQRTPEPVFQGCGYTQELERVARRHAKSRPKKAAKIFALETMLQPEQQQALLHALAWYDPFMGERSGRCSVSTELGMKKVKLDIGISRSGKAPSQTEQCPPDGFEQFVTSVIWLADRAVIDRGTEIPDYQYVRSLDPFEGF